MLFIALLTFPSERKNQREPASHLGGKKMAAASEDLRLSLSLCSSQNCFPLKLTLFPSSAAPSKARCINGETEEDAGAWSPVSTLSSLSGKRSERDDNEGDEDGQNSPKKLRLSKEQTMILEESFKEHNTLNPKQKQALAKQLNLKPRQVEVWFQNRRARTKLKQTEVECEYLKRWCQKLAEENKRLQKEVGDLRALKSAPPQLQMNASPPTTLTMCPSCESITTSPSSLTAAGPSSPPLQLPPHHRRQQGVVPAAADPNPWASYFFTAAS